MAYHHGVRCVVLANQLMGKRNLEIISELLTDVEFDFYCLVDSAAGVDLLGHYFNERGQVLQVLMEVGVADGRSGIRDDADQAAVVAALARWPNALRLAGVEVLKAW